MYFNPLFMQTASVEDPTQNIKQLKLSKDSYLFSDIIKLNYEKSKVGESDMLGSTGINDLENAVSSGMVIKKEDVLDSFVGMPSLEMFTIVEPKVLNSLVERVFQSNNKMADNQEYFVLNKDVNIAQDLKSEIYGSEEKLVEFLEQLLPGMALVDTSKQADTVSGTDSEEKDSNLSLLPLPEKENVIEDVLKRLKSGESVQIVAKVGDEKIRLDITKVTPKENEVEVFANTFIRKLNNIGAPANETASAKKTLSVKSTLNYINNAQVEENQAVKTEAGKNVIAESDIKLPNNVIAESDIKLPNNVIAESDIKLPNNVIAESEVDLSVSNNNNANVEVTKENVKYAQQPLVYEKGNKVFGEVKTNTASKIQEGKKILTENLLNKTDDTPKESTKYTTEVIQSAEEKVGIKVDKNIKNVTVETSGSEVSTKSNNKIFPENGKPVAKPSDNKETKPDLKLDVKTVKKEGAEGFEKEVVKTDNTAKSDLVVKENLSKSTKHLQSQSTPEMKSETPEAKNTANETIKNAELVKPSDTTYLEASRFNLQQKSFKSLKTEKETKEEKYKIEITQESTEEKAHEILKKSNLEVDNLMNYKNQSSKVNNDSALKNVAVKQSEFQEQVTKEEAKKSEQKIDKPVTDLKVSQTHENIHNVKPDTGMEKILKNTIPLKEVTKTIKSDEVIKELKTLIQSGEHKTMILKIMPENLGKMKVMLDLTDNKQVQANIEVENESVKQLIMSNVENLKQAISQSGLQLGGFSVSLSNPEQKMKREFEQKKKEQGGIADIKVEKTKSEEIKEKKLGYNTYEYLA